MAYKFQLGAARLSGSLTQEGAVTAESAALSGSTVTVAGGGLTIAGTAVTATAAELNLLGGVSGLVQDDFTKLAAVTATAAELNLLDNITRGSILVGGSGGSAELDAKTSGQILVGDGTDVASVAVSGDIGLAANGAMTIQASAVEGSMLNSNVAGTGLSLDGGNLDVAAAQTSITSIINSGLGVIGTAADQEYIDFGTSNEIHFVVNDTPVARATAGTFVVDGNLTVNGTTTSVNSTTLLVEDALIELNVVTGSEGRASNSGAGFFISGSTSANDASLTLTADGGRFKASGSSAGFDVQSGGDYRIDGTSVLNATTLGSAVVASSLTSVGALAAGSITSGFTAINVANVININSLDIDGATATTETADGDLMIIDDGAGGTNRKITLNNLKTYFQTGVSADSTNGFAFNTYSSSSSTNLNGTAGFWGTDAADGGVTTALNLDLSGSWSNGNVVIIKAANNAATNNITVRANVAGNQTIDGENSILLESDNAAVTLVYGNDNWNIV